MFTLPSKFDAFMAKYLDYHHPALAGCRRLIGKAALVRMDCDDDHEAADLIMCDFAPDVPPWHPDAIIEEVIKEDRELFEQLTYKTIDTEANELGGQVL